MLRANLPYQTVFSSIGTSMKRINMGYDNAVQNGAQFITNKMGARAVKQKQNLMDQGQTYYQNLAGHKRRSNMSDNQYRLYQLKGERRIDSEIQAIDDKYKRKTQRAQGVQNYLTSSRFKTDVGFTAGVGALGAFSASSE